MGQMITIKEAAKMVNLPTHTLRYYEQEGLLHPLKRDSNGNRVFSEDDIEWLKFICCLRGTGMSISEMKKFVAFYSNGDPAMEERMKILCDHKQALLEKMEEMKNYIERIDHKISWYDEQRKNLLNK